MTLVKDMKMLREIAETHGGIVETTVAQQFGISRMTLARLCAQGLLARIAFGQYVLADGLQDELLSLSLRSSKIVFSHDTALFLHGMSDRTPFIHTLTAPSNCAPSHAIKSSCKVHYIKSELFELGKTAMPSSSGNPVPCYDLERTICDVVRNRSQIGTETLLYALRQYSAKPEKDLSKLHAYSKCLHVEKPLRRYLEILL